MTVDDQFQNLSTCHQQIYTKLFQDPVIISDPYKFQRLHQIFGEGYDLVIKYGKGIQNLMVGQS
jgi:hypothetical protein